MGQPAATSKAMMDEQDLEDWLYEEIENSINGPDWSPRLAAKAMMRKWEEYNMLHDIRYIMRNMPW